MRAISIDGQVASPGRYPNTGYRSAECREGCKQSIRDSLLSSPDGYWNGADVVVRSGRWTIDRVPVLSHRKGNFILTQSPSYPAPTGSGYFLTNHLATLDQDGEWYYDTAARKLYLCSSVDPAERNVQFAHARTGFEIVNAGYITMANLDFRLPIETGGRLENTKHIFLHNILISQSGHNGLEVINSRAPWIEDCVIQGSANNGVVFRDVVRGSFFCNAILRTGMFAGAGDNGDGTYIALSVLGGKDNTIHQNRIEETGYIGIDFRSGGTTITNNLIRGFCLVKDDGGAIYTWRNKEGNNLVANNIISTGAGAGAGTADPHRAYASGIYIDDLSSDIVVRNNTVTECSLAGIYLHNSGQITVAGNKLFDNGTSPGNRDKGELYIRYDDIAPWPDGLAPRLRVRENMLTAVHEDSYCMFLRTKSGDNIRRLGLFSDNVFAAGASGQAVASVMGGGEMCIAGEQSDLATWQLDTSHEEGSTFVRTPQHEIKGPNLVTNSRMTHSTEGWSVWPDGSVLEYDKAQLAGPAIKVKPENNEGEVLLYHAGIQLKAATYRLSFIARSTEDSEVGFSMIMAQSPWATVSEQVCFSLDSVYQAYTFYFVPYPSALNKETRINFKGTTTLWIDNVNLVEMPAASPGAKSLIRLLYNSKESMTTVQLNGSYTDLLGKAFRDEITLQPFTSAILIQTRGEQ